MQVVLYQQAAHPSHKPNHPFLPVRLACSLISLLSASGHKNLPIAASVSVRFLLHRSRIAGRSIIFSAASVHLFLRNVHCHPERCTASPGWHLFSASHEKSARFVTIAPHRSHFLYGMDPIFIHTALILREFILLSFKAQNVQIKRQKNRT